MWPLQSEMQEFYGDPDGNNDGRPDPMWEFESLTRITPPWVMVLSWAPAKPLKSIAVHKKCAASLNKILLAIWKDCQESQAVIDAAGLNLFGGCYNFRTTRGGTSLSTHAYAAAIDLNPVGNPLGRRWVAGTGMMPMRTVERFEQEGWVWGGRWKRRPDCQHFQAARVS